MIHKRKSLYLSTRTSTGQNFKWFYGVRVMDTLQVSEEEDEVQYEDLAQRYYFNLSHLGGLSRQSLSLVWGALSVRTVVEKL